MKNKLLALLITLSLFIMPILIIFCPYILIGIGIIAGISEIYHTIYLELESEDNE